VKAPTSMGFGFGTRRLSLKARLISSYLIILGIGGFATSLVGSWIVSSTIMTQARRAVDHDFATARTVYEQQLQALKLPVEFAASGTTVQQYISSGDWHSLNDYLEKIRQDAGFDFLALKVPRGGVLLRASQPGRAMDDASSTGIVKAALSGKVVAGTEILPAGMTLMAAAPVGAAGSPTLGVLYGGVLLTGNFAIVDRVWELLFRGDRYRGVDGGAVTIFQKDLRISTSVRTAAGGRAVGTTAPPDVSAAVLKRGETWRGRAFVVKDWLISEYDPIRDYDGNVVGMLSVGIPENTYTSIRNRVVLLFFGIATGGFLLIIGITYYMIGNITRPIGQMVAATHNIIAGRFDQEVPSDSHTEIALLAESFNAMLQSLRQMRGDLEEWGRTLEEKVRQRTEELVAMQARVAQSERLASIGMLAAGVAHEINNPLGGILALTGLSVEDMREDDPNRENLEEVIRQTERCRDIVKGLLAFSRQSKSNIQLLDLNKVIEDTLFLVTKQALFFNINLVQNLAPDLPRVLADGSQCQQVFMNILMNAVQAMNERGTIAIATRCGASNSVEVAISDTGQGIPADQIDKIFDPFFTTKASGKGTGLGLSIAYGIVTTHRGTISVRSEVGKGSTFTVRLPIADE